jgi:hypothetical protein
MLSLLVVGDIHEAEPNWGMSREAQGVLDAQDAVPLGILMHY